MNTHNTQHHVLFTFIIPLCCVLGILGLQLIIILIRNDGVFSYILDDTYIHMALADHIALGHYGINANEFSSPSSSILWPLLLAPFSHTFIYEWTPLLINVTCVIGIIYMLHRMVILLISTEITYAKPLSLLLPLTSIILLNIPWMIMTGMEHNLQLLLTLCVITGIIHIQQTGKMPWWMIAGIIIGPLVRYENMSISLVGMVALWIYGYRFYAIILSVIVITLLAAFSAFLLSMDLPALPSSVLSKAGMRDELEWYINASIQLFHFIGKIASFPSGILLLCILGYAIKTFPNRNHKFLAGLAVLVIVAHFLVGPRGFYFRYERYLIAASLPVLFLLASQTLHILLKEKGRWPTSTLALLLFITYAVPTNIAYGVIGVPQASNNIYAQQYQMHRFTTEFYPHSVAVNDLGWVAYKNPHYILDFLGLASEASRKLRFQKDQQWMQLLVDEYDVGVVIIYENAFKKSIPPQWKKLAVMRITDELVTPAAADVVFYATNERSYAEVYASLQRFAPTLPANVSFEWIEETP